MWKTRIGALRIAELERRFSAHLQMMSLCEAMRARTSTGECCGQSYILGFSGIRTTILGISENLSEWQRVELGV